MWASGYDTGFSFTWLWTWFTLKSFPLRQSKNFGHIKNTPDTPPTTTVHNPHEIVGPYANHHHITGVTEDNKLKQTFFKATDLIVLLH
jgi:hypothetical protein